MLAGEHGVSVAVENAVIEVGINGIFAGDERFVFFTERKIPGMDHWLFSLSLKCRVVLTGLSCRSIEAEARLSL
jgi:hypothetical protein